MVNTFDNYTHLESKMGNELQNNKNQNLEKNERNRDWEDILSFFEILNEEYPDILGVTPKLSTKMFFKYCDDIYQEMNYPDILGELMTLFRDKNIRIDDENNKFLMEEIFKIQTKYLHGKIITNVSEILH